MFTRHLEIPIYEILTGEVQAKHYNRVQVALKRISNKQNRLRFKLPDLRTLDVILQPDDWIVVDTRLNDMPVAAWVDFKVGHRDNLHAPISCQVHLFHAHGSIILQRALDAVEQIIDEKLAEKQADLMDSKVAVFSLERKPSKSD